MSGNKPTSDDWHNLAYSVEVMLAREQARTDRLEAAPDEGTPHAVLLPSDMVGRVAALFRGVSARAQVDFDRIVGSLVTEGRAVLLPAVAAAASQQLLSDRHFPGGAIALGADSSRPHQLYLTISNDDGRSEPASVAARSADRSETVVMPITKDGVEGRVQVMLDTKKEADAVLARLLQDPASEIVVVWRP